MKFRRGKDLDVPHFGDKQFPADKLSGLMIAVYGTFVFALLAYAIIALFGNELFIPAKRGGFLFRGLGLKIIGVGILCAALNLIAKICGHYFNKDNERFEKLMKYCSITLLAGGFLADVIFWHETKFL